MSDLELYIYIALALIYFLSRALRKKKPVQPPAQRPMTPARQDYKKSPGEGRPVTFEDLLREFTGQKEEPVVAAEEEPVEVRAYTPDESNYEHVDETTVNDYDSYNAEYRKSYDEVYGQHEELKTLDEQVSLKAPERKWFHGYKIDEEANIHVAQRYREILKNKDSLKDAIILKEILDRKFF